jgi:hypothetical protein
MRPFIFVSETSHAGQAARRRGGQDSGARKAHIESLQIENDALTREVAILKETTKVMPEVTTFARPG